MKLSAIALLLTILPAAATAAIPEPWRIAGEPQGPALVTAIAPSARPDAGVFGYDRSWPQSTRDIVATPVFVDLNNDGVSEVIACDSQNISAFTIGGSLLWSWNVGDALMHVAAADVDGDGFPEIAVATTLPSAKLWLLDNAGIPLSGWPVSIPIVQLSNLTCPVIVDLDGDHHLDIGVAGEEGVFFFDMDGVALPGWPYLWSVPINNPQWSAPAVADVNGDGSLEVAVGNACSPNWGVYLLRADGTVMPGWPKVIKPVFSSPALADLNGDGSLEIIAQEGDPGSQGWRLWVWRPDGTPLPGWPQAIAADGWSSRCNPAVADVQLDGIPEIVTFTADSKLHIFLPSGAEMAGFPKSIAGVQPIASPSVLDVNNDGQQEIFLTYWLSSVQYVSGWNLAGGVLPGFPKVLYTGTDMNSHCSTHIMDANNDGVFEMATAGTAYNAGKVYVLTVDGSVAAPSSRMDWPKIRQNLMNHGRYLGINPADVAGNVDPSRETFRVAPNPVRIGARVAMTAPDHDPGSAVVCDAAGRILGCRAFAGTASVSIRDLVGSGAASGIYFLRWQPLKGAPRTARIVVIGE